MNEECIKRMIHLTMFEEIDGYEDIKISKYFQNDYIGLALLKNFIFITIAYIAIIFLLVIYNFEYLAISFADMNFTSIIIGVIIFYVIILAIYSAVVYLISKLRYERAAVRIRKYYRKLRELRKMTAPLEKVIQEGAPNHE